MDTKTDNTAEDPATPVAKKQKTLPDSQNK
jgi:hypothetical protein